MEVHIVRHGRALGAASNRPILRWRCTDSSAKPIAMPKPPTRLTSVACLKSDQLKLVGRCVRRLDARRTSSGGEGSLLRPLTTAGLCPVVNRTSVSVAEQRASCRRSQILSGDIGHAFIAQAGQEIRAERRWISSAIDSA